MYQQFYGLREEPFNITPDPTFFFYSKNHEEAFASLLYGIKSRKGFLKLTGPVGTGKTTLCRALLDRLYPEAQSALVLNPNLSGIQLLETIVEDFDIKVSKRDRKAYFNVLNSFFMNLFKENRTALLIIDEAQDLKPSTLEQIRLLSNFETNKAKLLQILIIGQPELDKLLSRPSLAPVRQRIAISATLAPLDREETERYIRHRIYVAGGHDMLIFDSAAIDTIYEYSNGIPRLINILCDKALLMAYTKQNGVDLRQILQKAPPLQETH